MQRRIIPEAETKLVILFALDRLGPVTDMQLLQFMADNDLMNYFTLQINLAELVEQGQVSQQAHPLGQLLTVSEDGSYALEVFGSRIPASQRALITDKAPAAHRLFRADQQTPAVSLTGDGPTRVRLCLMESGAPLLDMVLHLPEGCTLTFLQQRWHAAAQPVFDAVTRTLMQGYETAAPLPGPIAAPPVPDGRGGWTLSLANDDASFTLLLSLPDEHLAHWSASLWPAVCRSLRQNILQTLLAVELP